MIELDGGEWTEKLKVHENSKKYSKKKEHSHTLWVFVLLLWVFIYFPECFILSILFWVFLAENYLKRKFHNAPIMTNK